MIAKIKNYCHSKHSYNNIPVKGVAKIMKKYRHKLFRRGVCVAHGVHWMKPPEARGLYNRKDDVFDHFGSAFNNMKFRLWGPFLTIPLRTDWNFNVLDYTNRPLTGERVDGHVTLYPSKPYCRKG